MKKLQSDKFKLPLLYFITNREEILELPVGVPFIYGDEKIKPYLIRQLEYEVLYQKALKTGYPFNFKKILKDNGFNDLKEYWYSHPAYMDFTSGENIEMPYLDDDKLRLDVKTEGSLFKQFAKDASAYVDISKLKELNIFPTWLDNIEEAVKTNIHSFATFNPNMYNKKLEGMYGGVEFSSPKRNLIIIDISGSIPKAVSQTCLALSKNLAETFYTDLLITGSKSTLYPYERLYELNIDTIYEENGMDNDQVYFRKLVTNEEKQYDTAIVFGDNHSPCNKWNNEYNKGTREISRNEGKSLCKWKIDKLISFHTSVSGKYIAGYADWFTISESNITKIKNWVKYL